ncbi:MAG3450 family membrane protein [Mesomycoplasma dispar]|uniref:Uncharacterized protein n=1 Tax=Mesomycoplasma dispar TaxID=86660 RepID=A0ABN5DVK9_9BACT|nr:hypothetical protein [Mesomycoplasma dispar]ATP59872.1 hypothetical protein CSW10_02970 [Mesomycoplasma dispar]
MHKKITKIPDFFFALITIIAPIGVVYAFFSPDFYGKELISYWILFVISVLIFLFSIVVSTILTKLKVVNFSFAFYYSVISFSLTILLLTYPFSLFWKLLILRVFLVLLSIFLIIPSLIIKKKIEQFSRKRKVKKIQ